MEELDGAGNDLGGSEPFRFGAGDKQPQNFTWYESFTEAMLELPTRDEQVRFVADTGDDTAVRLLPERERDGAAGEERVAAVRFDERVRAEVLIQREKATDDGS